MEVLPSTPLKFDTYIAISMGITGGQIYPLPQENMWISRLLIELQSSSKKQKNPHSQLIWGEITFQSSIYDRFPLKPGCVKNIPHPEAQSSSKNLENFHTHLYWVE